MGAVSRSLPYMARGYRVNGSLLTIIIASQLIGLAGVGLAALATNWISKVWVHRMIAFAVGTMLATALLDILPEALSAAPANRVLQAVLVSILVLFAMEKAALWRHRYLPENVNGSRAHLVWIVVIGDGLHNFTDGVLIAASFAANPQLGWLTTLAIVAHEIPQEIGDFLVLRNAGLSQRNALWLNFLSSFTAVIGGIAGYLILEKMHSLLPYVLACCAAGFLYIAIADLMPAMNQHWSAKETRWQALLLVCGVLLIPSLHTFAH